MKEPLGIYNWYRLNDRVTTSGQPDEEQLKEIADLGVSTIINLAFHDHEKALPNEIASTMALGMDYIHIPVIFTNPTEEDFEQFCAVLENLKEEKLHIHCIANYRVSSFVYRYRVEVMGKDEAEARKDLLNVWQPDEVWAKFIKLPN